MLCQSCGAQIAGAAGFCKYCGAKISPEQAAGQASERAASAESYHQIQVALAKERGRKLKKWLIIIVSAIVLFYALGYVFLYHIVPVLEANKPHPYTAAEIEEMRAKPVDLTQPGALSGKLHLLQNVCRSVNGYGWDYEVYFEMAQISDTEYESVSCKVDKVHESTVELPSEGFQVDMVTEKIHIKVTGKLTAVLTYDGREDMLFALAFQRSFDGSMIEGSGEINAVDKGGTFSSVRVVHE